jgi:putative CRISPR-associated protein (TIGR02620 family)
MVDEIQYLNDVIRAETGRIEMQMIQKLDNPIIITRHQGLIEWLSRKGITGTVIEHISDDKMIFNRVVIGNLPLALASRAKLVITVDLPNLRADQRGKDLTPEEMDEAGAFFMAFIVTRKYLWEI